ncbi:hypothetical protein CF326_g3313 [Tilletia indica]|nr:hypothetical protein CF326_g3313 [Tilletia indica]
MTSTSLRTTSALLFSRISPSAAATATATATSRVLAASSGSSQLRRHQHNLAQPPVASTSRTSANRRRLLASLATTSSSTPAQQQSYPHLPSVAQHDRKVGITWASGLQSKYHNVWLRDHCRCPSCYHPTTKQRLLDTFSIPEGIRPDAIEATTEGLQVTWPAKPLLLQSTSSSSSPQSNNDADQQPQQHQHISLYPWRWLMNNSYAPVLSRTTSPQPQGLGAGGEHERILWGRGIASAPPTVSYEDVMGSEEGVLKWCNKIVSLLASLQDAGLPNLDTRTSTRAPAESLRTSDRKSLLRFLGLPLNLFAKDAFFQPYLPLQQIDLLKGSTYLVGTSNSIYRQQKDCAIDVIVDLEHSTLEFVNPLAQRLSALTAPDRKWMAELENLVLSTWNPADPTRPAGMQYEGSDDHLRARFEEYICALLASVKHYQFDRKVGKGDAALAGASGSSTHAFGTDFLEAFMRTKAFPSWNDSTDPMIFDIIDHRHPCDGKTSAIEDVGLRLAAGLQDMHLEENLAPARQVVVSALSQGGAGLFRFASGLRSEVVKLREGRLASSGEVEGGGGSNTTSSTSSRPASMTLSAAGGADKRTSVSSSTSSVNNKDLPASPPLPSPSPLSPASFMSGFRIPGTSSSTTSTSSSSHPTGADGGGGGHPSSSSSSSSATATQIADVASQTADRAAQAAAQAGTQVRAALGNFGSFLAKQQRQWAAPAPTPASSASGSTPASTSTVPGGSVATSLKSTTTSAGNTAVAAAAGLGSWATSLVGGSASASSSSSAGAPSGVSAKTTLPAPPLPPPAPLAKDVPELPLPPPPPTGGEEKEEEEEEVYVVDDGFDTVSRESVAESDTAAAPPADEKDVPTTTTYPPLPAVRSP